MYRPPGANPTWDWNRCVPDPEGQLRHLRQRGDIVGYRMSPDVPDPDSDMLHWQSIVRPAGSTGHTFFAGKRDSKGAMVAVATVGHHRNTTGKRLGATRTSLSEPDWKVSPPLEDKIRAMTIIDKNYEHPGGMQMLGSYLLVGIEDGPGSAAGQIVAMDASAVTDTNLAVPTPKWSLKAETDHAGVAAAAKLTDDRYLFVTANEGIKMFEFYIGKGSSFASNPFASLEHGHLYYNSVPGFQRSYQHVSLIVGCPESPDDTAGTLYLLGMTNTAYDDWVTWDHDDYADLIKLTITPLDDPNTNDQWNIHGDFVADDHGELLGRHLYCTNSSADAQCHFSAATGSYVDPDGRLLLYATEWENQGPFDSVKMVEFRPTDHLENPDTDPTEGCTAIGDAFVELYDDSLSSLVGPTDMPPRDQNSYLIEYGDTYRRSWNFDAAFDFDDKVAAARYCIPPGYSFRLFKDRDLKGGSELLRGDATVAGTGNVSNSAIEGYSWGSTGFSSGCFVRNVAPDVCAD
ncbi:MAG: hypothetical protein ABI867_18660 [Kofleriaceae bacterium]